MFLRYYLWGMSFAGAGVVTAQLHLWLAAVVACLAAAHMYLRAGGELFR